jgi:VIT1/CCC1 family predicted Fe2+/Mn2+ transporter
MSRFNAHSESHLVARIGWLRAAVMGANDGLVSTASLIVGVAAASADKTGILVAGVAGLVAGAMSMAAGEYVSVSSQSDTEKADLARETAELAADPAAEARELAGIYEARGLEPALAAEVAAQLMTHDALGAHARDELGISEFTAARPIQAALTSALTFSAGASLPLLVVIFVPAAVLVAAVSCAALLGLAVLGALGAKAGGASLRRAIIRVVFWGALAMAVTAGIGRVFGAVV